MRLGLGLGLDESRVRAGPKRSRHRTPTWLAWIVAGVRKYGTYKKYMRVPHREFLAVRGLAQRGKLRTDHRALNFIAKLGERGVVWHILTYWRPTE